MLDEKAPRTDGNIEASTAGAPTRVGVDVIRGSGDPAATRMGGLVLTRRLGQAIVIADVVEVQVVDIKPHTVRLKIVAPRSIPVHRREVFESIRAAPRPVMGDAPAPVGPSDSGRRPGALVLTRHAGEEIMIGDDVVVEVGEIRSHAVRLRVAAPRDISVHRREIHDAIRAGSADRVRAGEFPGP